MLHRRAEHESGVELPNPNLFYFVHSQRTEPEAAAKLLPALRRLSIVEASYFQPIPFDAVDIAPTTTIDVTPQQGYFRPSPVGIDVDIARRFAGGRGEGVRIVDIEAGWHLDHEDLPPVSFGYGINFGFIDGAHGTAVLGEIAAQENGFGANGIVPSSRDRLVVRHQHRPAHALADLLLQRGQRPAVGWALPPAGRHRPHRAALPNVRGAVPQPCNCASSATWPSRPCPTSTPPSR